MNRYKLRRVLEDKFKEINSRIEASRNTRQGSHKFHLEYTYHFIDDLIIRKIDVDYVLQLVNRIDDHLDAIDEHMSLPYPPTLDLKRDDQVQYRPIRLEITDGNLWIGLTTSKIPPSGEYSSAITCRMAIVNSRRLSSNVTTRVIKVEGL
ncbi:endoribonuclease [Aeromonas phage Riv-10]|uniref:Site-specific RNA endonuclease n=2 Tax=Biquartavirus 44RR2 TaxID=115987 RepID=Q6U9J4_9CAUD|nr:endoribonuclease [Aeromonas phage 44RR2.8t]AAQ81427.1 site-specific RNA endonuclease [Aeromonas phage 44RR2.8t]APU00579.1 endoribonuclease [Aeromonas phage 44RR2.8t.2]APU02161.1 endoribonuclease [Aeromonas phage Riv-10]